MKTVKIRRKPYDPCQFQMIHPQDFGDTLPGAALAVLIPSTYINLYFQDHEYNLVIYEYRKDT